MVRHPARHARRRSRVVESRIPRLAPRASIRRHGRRTRQAEKDGEKLGKVSDAKLSGAAKTAHKAERNQAKNQRRLDKGLAEDDIDAILAALAIEDARRADVVIEKDCPRPLARGHASLTATNAVKPNELILYGASA